MDAFSFVFSLFGLLLGLALAEVLGGLGTAIEMRRKVRVGWLTPLLGLFVAIDLTSFWTMAWSLRDAIPPNYISLLFGLLLTGIYYLAARLVFPRHPAEWPDYDVHYFEHRRLVLGGVLLCNLLVLAVWPLLGENMFASASEIWSLIAFLILVLAAMSAPGPRASAALLVLLCLLYPTLSLMAVLIRH